MPTRTRRRWLLLLLVPLGPLLISPFTEAVAWTPVDALAAGLLLAGAGLAYAYLARRGGPTHRISAGLAVGAALGLVWAALAVGLLGSEDDPANALYLGVLAVGGVGAWRARGRPRGMARAMAAAAVAVVLVAVVALAAGLGQPASGPAEVVLVNALFAGLFGLAAWCYGRTAAQTPAVRRSA